ncbi:MAG: glucose-1-phosphate adenylyltransferase subunit GlgD [Firmicutes bacterium]|nr:glucose-1-phosphate adenylyltransferase subunit GlgD [Bacillota bacterium]MDD4264036.1 glucose-1-phosphate adenylyltransferase subunit GlgD [Bacillota bacterium]MDD4693984.1 glucose-1-phosphate adenylyltransferase subunit GlgD [Bacillota bacterium]
MAINVNDLMGVLILAENQNILKELTMRRQLAAIPFGARYRIIDFALSNLVNAGIRNVGVFVQEKYRSLMDHLGIGKEWDLNRQRDGLFILPPEKYNDGSNSLVLNGDILLLRRHLDYLIRSKQEYVVIFNGPIVMNIDLKRMFEKHLASNADISLLYQVDSSERQRTSNTEILTDQDSRVTSIKINPFVNSSLKMLLDTFIMKRTLLIELVDSAVAEGGFDLVRDILIKNLKSLRIYGCEFSGYARKINSLECYFKTSMELLDPKVSEELFFAHGPIFTKVKNEPPVIYTKDADVKNSLVANGCRIEGTVENSILFRGVKIEKGAQVKNSIIMQKSSIGNGSALENVIIDKDCVISPNKRLMGAATYPLVIGKATVL